MTDNSDLLGVPAPLPANPVIVSVDLGKPGGDLTATVTAEVLPDGKLNILDVVSEPAQEHKDAERAALVADLTAHMQPPDVTDLLAGVSAPEADGSTSYELAPVSTEYAAAQANRVRIIGQTNRDYAYKRVLRAGRKL